MNYKQGITCSLTNKKPDFNRTCARITFDTIFEEKLKDVNIAYENCKRKRFAVYTNSALFFIGALLVFGAGYFIGVRLLDNYIVSTVPLIIMGAGLPLLGVSIGLFVKLKQELNMAKHKKQRIEEVLDMYHITYVIKIEYLNHFHGEDIHTSLEVKGID